MAKTQESIADIVAAMRMLGKLDEKSIDKIPRSLMALGLRTYADLIEAAWEREECSRRGAEAQSGNAAKLREAMEQIRDMIMGGGFDGRSPAYIVNICDAALAKPPRNCDVGTARQQEKRHKEEACLKSACPKHEGFVCNACKGCFAIWAQMPYEEGGAK